MSSVPTSHHVGRWGWGVGGNSINVHVRPVYQPLTMLVGGGWEVTQLTSSEPTSHHFGRWGWEVTQLMSSVPTPCW